LHDADRDHQDDGVDQPDDRVDQGVDGHAEDVAVLPEDLQVVRDPPVFVDVEGGRARHQVGHALVEGEADVLAHPRPGCPADELEREGQAPGGGDDDRGDDHLGRGVTFDAGGHLGDRDHREGGDDSTDDFQQRQRRPDRAGLDPGPDQQPGTAQAVADPRHHPITRSNWAACSENICA